MPEPVTEVSLSGGGAKNPTLVAMIARAVAPMRVRAFADCYFDGEAKEAVAFALLAYLYTGHQPGNVPRATGARGPRVLGNSRRRRPRSVILRRASAERILSSEAFYGRGRDA